MKLSIFGAEGEILSHESDDRELVAGMAAAALPVLDDMGREYYVGVDGDISGHRVLKGVFEKDIWSGNYRLPKGGRSVFLWLRSSQIFSYDLYTFETDSFVQGLVSVASSFQVDFRNYILGLPFDLEGEQYEFEGYLMKPYLYFTDVPDTDDVEEDEAADENVIEPLARTDDIYTFRD